MSEVSREKSKNSMITGVIVGILAVLGIVVGIIFFMSRPQTISTGNARVTTDLVYISSMASGRLERFNIVEGQFVQTGDVLGWVQSGESMRSPVNGVVLHTLVALGQEVAAGEPLAVIADTSKIHVQANIDEVDIKKIAAGQKARVTIDPFGNRNFSGYVRNVKRANEIEIAGFPVRINTGGTFRRIMQTIPVEIVITDDVDLSRFLGASARVNLYVGVIKKDITNSVEFVNNKITAEGLVESANRQTVFSNLGFMIRRVYVREGDSVSQGQVLAALDANDAMLNAALTQAENNYRTAKTELETREVNHESMRQLHGAGTVTRHDFRQSQDALTISRNNYNIARAQLNSAQLALGRLSIRSPINGIVTAANAREGAIGAGLMFVVEDADSLIVRARFREYDIARLQTGMQVSITPVATNGEYAGTISRIHPAAVKDESGETLISPAIEFEAEIAVTSTNTNLRIGMTARLTIDLDNQSENQSANQREQNQHEQN